MPPTLAGRGGSTDEILARIMAAPITRCDAPAWTLWGISMAGFNALFFMLLCFGVSAVMERYIRSTFVTHMLFALPAPFLYGLLYWLCFILIKGVDGGTNTLFTFYLPCALYTAVVAPILWFLLRPLRQRLNRKALQ